MSKDNQKKAKRDASGYALWSHVALAFIAGYVLILVLFSLFSPEGSGMALFLSVYIFGLPVLIVTGSAIIFTLISSNYYLIPATVSLLLIALIAHFQSSSMVVLATLLVLYIGAVAWAYNVRKRCRD